MSRKWLALVIEFPADPGRPVADESALPLEERLAVVLDDFSPAAIQEGDGAWRVFFTSAEARDGAARSLEHLAPEGVRATPLEVGDEDWARRSQAGLTAVRVGRVVVAPPWASQDAAAPDAAAPEAGGHGTAVEPATRILILPSMGFGTGHHASTRLCLQLLQEIDLLARTLLDLGTGSGVLAMAARRLGAGQVTAVDDDVDAIESARENLALNGLADDRGLVLRHADFRAANLQPADIVTANLTASLLERSAETIASCVAAGGSLVLGGFTPEDEARVRAAFPALTVAARAAEDGWVGLRLSQAASHIPVRSGSTSTSE